MQFSKAFTEQEEIQPGIVVTRDKVYFDATKVEGEEFIKGHSGHEFLLYKLDGTVSKCDNLWFRGDRKREQMTHFKVESDYSPYDRLYHFEVDDATDIWVVPRELAAFDNIIKSQTKEEIMSLVSNTAAIGADFNMYTYMFNRARDVKGKIKIYRINDSVDYKILKLVMDSFRGTMEDYEILKELLYQAPWNYSIYPYKGLLDDLKKCYRENFFVPNVNQKLDEVLETINLKRFESF